MDIWKYRRPFVEQDCKSAAVWLKKNGYVVFPESANEKKDKVKAQKGSRKRTRDDGYDDD